MARGAVPKFHPSNSVTSTEAEALRPQKWVPKCGDESAKCAGYCGTIQLRDFDGRNRFGLRALCLQIAGRNLATAGSGLMDCRFDDGFDCENGWPSSSVQLAWNGPFGSENAGGSRSWEWVFGLLNYFEVSITTVNVWVFVGSKFTAKCLWVLWEITQGKC